MSYDYLNMIQQIRGYYSVHSDGFSLPERPVEIGKYDWSKRFYENFEILKKYGRITWGCVVQTEASLLEEGDENQPLTMVFSDHPLVDESPELLVQVARELYGYKGQMAAKVPGCMREAARALRHVISQRSVYIKLKDSGKYRFNAHLSMVPGFREHLPGYRLEDNVYSIIYLPYKPEVVMILPEEFQNAWIG